MKKIVIFTALITYCVATKAQTLSSVDSYNVQRELVGKLKDVREAFPILVGSTIKFSEKINIRSIESFYVILPDTLWIRKRKNPVIERDFLLCQVYKGFESPKTGSKNARTITTNGMKYVLDYSGFIWNGQWLYSDERCRGYIRASTPPDYIMGKSFLVVSSSTNRYKTKSVWTPERKYHQLKLQDIATGEQLMWMAYDINSYPKDYIAYDDERLMNGVEIVNKGDKYLQLERKITSDYIAKRRSEYDQKKGDGRHTLSLTTVAKPSNSQIRFGKTATEEAGTKFSYSDNYISIIWIPTSKDFNFILTNNSPNSMRILWDEAVYVDENGMVNKMIHEGVKLIDRNNPQTPSVVPQGANISDLLAPVNKISYNEGWVQLPLFNKTDKEKLDDKTVRISLPLQIQNVTNEYVFTFKISWEYTNPELQNMSFQDYLLK